MMRQYELVERVRSYDPSADEDALNRAYVFSMKAHGGQKRASGDPYFSHPVEVAGILTDIRLDTDSIVTALLHDTVEDTVATLPRDRDAVRQERRAAGRRRHQAVATRAALARRAPGGELPQAAARHLRRYPRAAGQAGRPAAQHADAGLHQLGRSRARIARETMDIYAPLAERIGMQQMKDELEDLAFAELNPDARAVAHRAARFPARRGRKRRAAHRRRARRRAGRGRAHRQGHGPRKAALFDLAQDAAQERRLRAALRHHGVPRDRGKGRALLPGARHHPHALPLGAGAVQGLHLDAQAQRLPLAAHHGDRPRAAPHRDPDPHARHARGRRARRRRALAVQTGRRAAHRGPPVPLAARDAGDHRARPGRRGVA